MVIMASGIARWRVRVRIARDGGHTPAKWLTETYSLDL